LTVVLPGAFHVLPDETPHPLDDSKPNEISVWRGDVDPEFDLPCGELEFRFEIHTPALGLTEEGPIDYDLYPSYATTVLNLILTLGSYVDGVKPDFLKTIDKPFNGLKYTTGLGEFEFGALDIHPMGAFGQNFLIYEMTNLSFKTDFGVGKIINPIVGLVSGLVKIKPPAVSAKFVTPKFNGNDGLFDTKAELGAAAGVELSLDDEKAIGAEKKALEKLKKKLGKKFGKRIGGASLEAELKYAQAYVQVKGVDNPKFKFPDTKPPNRGITEETEFSGKFGLTTPEIDIGAGFVSGFAGPAAPAVYAVIKALDINILSIQLGSTVGPKFVQKMKLENFDPLGYPVRVVEVDANGDPKLSETTFGHVTEPSITFKYLLAFTVCFGPTGLVNVE